MKDKELLEHQFTRFFKHLGKLDYTERLQRLGLQTLEERRNRADLIKVYKIVSGLSTLPTSTFFEFRTDTRTFTDNNNNNNDRLTAFDPGQPG